VNGRCRRSVIAALAMLASASSAFGQTGSEGARCGDQPLGLEWSLSIPISRIERRIVVTPDGRGEVDLLTSWSMPGGATDVIGSFAGPVPGPEFVALQALARHHHLARSRPRTAGGPQPLTEVYQALVVTCGAQRHVVEPTRRNQSALNVITQRLAALALGLVSHPRAAVRLTLEGGSGGRPLEAVVAQVGTEPVEIELFDSAEAAFWARIRLDDWGSEGPPAQRGLRQPVASATMPLEQVRELAARGVIPTGVRRLAVGERLAIPLDGLAAQLPGQGAGQLTVNVNAWRPGPGLARASFELESGPLALTPSRQ
jgi:hypothetical protein